MKILSIVIPLMISCGEKSEVEEEQTEQVIESQETEQEKTSEEEANYVPLKNDEVIKAINSIVEKSETEEDSEVTTEEFVTQE